MQLEGKTAFVTGGSAGIGKAFVTLLLQHGVKVVFTGRDVSRGEAAEAEFSRQFGAENVRFMAFDVIDQEAYEAKFSEAVKHLGHVDLMINNAGVLDEARWEMTIDINVKGSIFGTALAARHMRKDKGGHGGRIINVISIVGIIESFASPVYTSTKHALRAYTSSLAQDPSRVDQGIEYALIAPDVTDTPLIDNLDSIKVPLYAQIKDQLEQMKCKPEAISEGLLHLLQHDVINGAILHVNKDGKSFRRLQVVDDGLSFDPARVAGSYFK